MKGGWWCDEWFCQMFFCTYRYNGLADAEEVAFAASIALQAYFEGRKIGPGEMKKCIDFYNGNISERTDPIRRKRPVCCEPYMVPLCTCDRYYRCTHPKRVHENKGKDQISDRLREVYERYDIERLEQMDAYSNFHGPVRVSTVCRAFGCRRFYGRKGFCFCTEGCDTCWSDCCTRQAGDPAPPFTIDHDFDDEWDASSVLLTVIGPPPTNVVIRRWRYDPETNANYLDIYPPPS